MFRNPEEINISCFEEVKAKDAWIEVAQTVLSICWKSKGGNYFH
jgi:hypothetical protein